MWKKKSLECSSLFALHEHKCAEINRWDGPWQKNWTKAKPETRCRQCAVTRWWPGLRCQSCTTTESVYFVMLLLHFCKQIGFRWFASRAMSCNERANNGMHDTVLWCARAWLAGITTFLISSTHTSPQCNVCSTDMYHSQTAHPQVVTWRRGSGVKFVTSMWRAKFVPKMLFCDEFQSILAVIGVMNW